MLLCVVRRWHLLSLDAPTVAAVWMLTFSASQPWRVRLPQAAALALSVWLLYVADRLLDARRARGNALQARHLFHADFQRRFVLVSAVFLPILLVLVSRLPEPVRNSWCWLLFPMACYVAAVHVFPVRRLPKELVVSLMFAAAAVLPSLLDASRDHRRNLVLASLFAGLCWLNCVAIARWESEKGWFQSARSTGWGAAHLPVLCGLYAIVCGATLPLLGGVAAACAAGALLLLLLERSHRRLDAVALRALADAALLTPVLLLLPR